MTTRFFAKAACLAGAIISAAALVMFPMIDNPPVMTAEAATDYEYALFPGEVLQITQGAFNEYNAYSHKNTNAFDLGGNTYYTAPFTGKIVAINQAYHMVMFQSENKVRYADGTIDYMTVSFTHDNNISNLSVGKRIKQGTRFYEPGTYPPGSSTGSHVHLAVFRGKVNKASSNGNVYPNDALWLKRGFTKIKQTGSYCWASLNKNGTDTTKLTDGAVITISPNCNKNLYIAEAGTKNLSNVKLTDKVTNAAKWKIHKCNGYVYLENMESHRVLDIYGTSVAAKRNVQVYQRSTDSASMKTQNFILKPDGNGSFAIQSWSSRRVVIDCYGDKPAKNSNVWTYLCMRNSTQLYTIKVVG